MWSDQPGGKRARTDDEHSVPSRREEEKNNRSEGGGSAKPPVFDGTSDFFEFQKDVDRWNCATRTHAEKRGAVLYLSLTGRARQVARQINTSDLIG